MHEPVQTLVILAPAFAASETDSWLPAQEAFVRSLNHQFPALQVVILSFHYPVQQQRDYRWFGNEVTTFSGNMKGKWNSLQLWRQVWKKLGALHRERHILGIFSFFCSECAFVGHYFARRHRLLHRIWILGQDAKAGNKQVRRIRPAATDLIAISDFLVREFERNHAIRPAHMIPTGIDAAAFPKETVSRDIDLLAAGSLIPLKQYPVFIEVVYRLSQQLPQIKAVLCGDGPELDTLRSLAEQKGIGSLITFTGNLPRESVLQYMQRSKIFLHPSEYEGFGMVCAEALYAGAHVISRCKPLDRDFPHWHIVPDTDAMTSLALELLQQPQPDHLSSMTFPVEETALQIMRCFGYPPSNVSI